MADVAAVVAAAAGSRGIGIGGNLVSLRSRVWCGLVVVWWWRIIERWCALVPGCRAGRGEGSGRLARPRPSGAIWGGAGEEWFENSIFSSWSLPPHPHPQPGIIYDADHYSSPFRPSFSSPCLVLVPPASSSVDAPLPRPPAPSVLIHRTRDPTRDPHNSRGDFPAT